MYNIYLICYFLKMFLKKKICDEIFYIIEEISIMSNINVIFIN